MKNKQKTNPRPYGYGRKMRGAEKSFQRFGNICLVAIAVLCVWAAIASYHAQRYTLPPIVETAHAEESQQKPSHFLLKYTVNGQDYYRTLSYAMEELVSGTARDHGIHPNHLLAICIQEGTEFVGKHAFACSPTASKPDEGAVGAFQIRAKYHGIKLEDAQHPYYSAVWTADRLLRYGYNENPYYAMGRHNGGGAAARRYAGKVWQIAQTMHWVQDVEL